MRKGNKKNSVHLLCRRTASFCMCVAAISTAQVMAREADYADPWCAERGGVAEKVLADRTRVDCLLPDFAIEVDYASKWAEAMGQALHYARMTQRRPGVLLILRQPADMRYARRLYLDAQHWGVPLFVWTVTAAPAEAKQ